MDLQDLSVGLLQVPNKQWGLGSPSINFPIAFPKECFIAAITRAAGNYEHSIVITTKNKTNLSWICKGYDNSAGNTYANWLALGCQLQWGASGYAVTFPIAFNVVYNVLSIPQTTASTSNAYWGRFYITALNKNGFNVSDTGAGSNRWIAIGSAQPQWGYSTVGSGAWALKFNGVYTAVVVGAPGFPAREFCGFTFDYTLTGWSFTAGYNSPVSYIRPTTTAISLGY